MPRTMPRRQRFGARSVVISEMQIRDQTPHHGGAAALDPGRSSALAAAARYGPAFAGYALPFLLVFYLAMKGGGYDPIVRGEIGVAVWWIVLLGAVAGVLPAARLSRAGLAMLVLLGAFAIWTALGMSWSESSERSMAEAARVAAYAGVLCLALVAQGRDAVRRAAYSVGAAIALVSALALLSRLHSEWFPANEAAAFLPQGRRLNYPLDYWNGLAALVAIGVPLVLSVAAGARHIFARALAAAALPAMALTVYYTLSRGGAVEIVVGLVVLVALYPRRLQLMPTLLSAGVGSGLVIAAGAQRDQLADGLTGATASSQADEMLAVVIVACVGVGLIQAAIALAERHDLIRAPVVSRSGALAALGLVAIVCLVGALAFGAPGKVADGWDDFKADAGPDDSAQRFASASGNGRYQWWSSMVDAAETDPLTGIGPGTFEFWWAREGTRTGFVRDGHSLYFESLGELGVPGLILISALILFVLWRGAAAALAADPERRALLAAATAGCAAFAVAAGIDWVWEIPVLPVCFLLLAAALAAPRLAAAEGARPAAAERTRGQAPSGSGRFASPGRIALVVASLAALVVVAIPLAGEASVRESQDLVRSAQLSAALDEAQTAKGIEPYAATPNLQEALVLERRGDFESAAAAAREATADEPTNWRTWFVLSRLEARVGNVEATIDGYRRARDLNPRSPLFQQ
ncbi:MAG: tetratricopeptide repeat protein [Solirubrobacterales bacterium]|nr:tetratricopeptide repeat protein [Solirubrobacterales bacterium]